MFQTKLIINPVFILLFLVVIPASVSAADCTGTYEITNNCGNIMVELDCPDYFSNRSTEILTNYTQCEWNTTNAICVEATASCDYNNWVTSSSSSSFTSSTSSSSYASSTSSSSIIVSSSTSSSQYASTTSSSSSSRRSSSSSSSIMATTTTLNWYTLNTTVDSIIGLLPKFGDLLTSIGTNLIWPVVYILIILGIAGIILGLFAMIVGIVSAVVIAVTRFSHKLGCGRR